MAGSSQKVFKSSRLTVPAGPGTDGVSALAEVLTREFDAPIGLLDPEGPDWRLRMGNRVEAFPAAEASVAAAQESGVLAQGRVMLWSPERDRGPVWLGLPAAVPGGGMLVALVGFSAGPDASSTAAWGPATPARALIAWGQVVAERLRAEAAAHTGPADPAGPPASGELPLFDRLTRRLRVSDPPERFQRLAASALREALGVAAVAWVPSHPREPAIVAGGVEGLAVEAYRTLLPERKDEPVRIVNDPAGLRQGCLKRIAVVTADPAAATGWFVAVNPLTDRPFTAAAIELIRPVASLVSAQQANAQLYIDLKQLLFGVIRALTSAIDAKDPYTSGHSERVARIAVRLGEQLGMSATQRGDLYLMGLLHDIGKIGIDDVVLKKGGPLTSDEFRQIQSHVRIGVHILSDLKKLHHLLPGVAHHHESLDGTGYPSGLAGDEIPLVARVLAVADAFDAMSSTRPYRRRLTPPQIEEIFRRGIGLQWDPQVVNALFACCDDLDHIRQKGLGESLNRVVDDTLGRS